MTEQLQIEIVRAKESLATWEQREREATEQVRLGRGYLQGLLKALELAQAEEQAAKSPAIADEASSM